MKRLKKLRDRKFNTVKLYVSKIIIFCLVLTAGTLSDAANLRHVSEIEFRGLRYLSKFNIINRVKTAIDNNGIIIDMDSLESALKRTALIEKYNIVEAENRIIIKVTEKKIFANFALLNKGRLIPFEVDENFKIISQNRIHNPKKPVIIIGNKDMDNGKLSEKAKYLSRLINSLKKKHSSIYDEISEIYLIDNEKIRINLFSRKTDFILLSNKEGLLKLKYITGYLDRIRYYPKRLDITEGSVIIL